jgi:DNA repair exonuclease SbcCD nuclease subunit
VLGAPVLYPGSIERTSFAERDEAKHYLLLAASEGESPGGSLDEATFVDLPARPMATLTLRAQEIEGDHIENVLEESLSALDPDAVVRIRVEGRISQEARGLLTAERLRRIAPASMNVSLRVVSDMR